VSLAAAAAAVALIAAHLKNYSSLDIRIFILKYFVKVKIN